MKLKRFSNSDDSKIEALKKKIRECEEHLMKKYDEADQLFYDYSNDSDDEDEDEFWSNAPDHVLSANDDLWDYIHELEDKLTKMRVELRILESNKTNKSFSNRDSLIRFLPNNYQSYTRVADNPYHKFKLSIVPADDYTLESLENGELLGVLKDSPSKFLFRINPHGAYYVIDSKNWRTYYLRAKE